MTETNKPRTFAPLKQNILALAAAAALVLQTQPSAIAGLLRVDSESFLSARSGTDLRRNVPLQEFMQASYISDNRNIEANTAFSFYGDPLTPGVSGFDLYLLDAVFEPIPDFMTVRMGRTFNVHTSSRTSTTDSIETDYSLFGKRVKLGAMAGVERKFYNVSIDSTANFIGGHVQYRSSSMYPLFLQTKYHRRSLASRDIQPQHLLAFSGRKQFAGKWSPEFLASSELDVTPGNLNIGEAGFDLYPSSRLFVRTRGMTYFAEPSKYIEQPIFTLFSSGRLYEGMVEFGYQFSSALTASTAMAYDVYKLENSSNANGYRLEAGLRHRGKFNSTNDSFYFIKSYGGNVYGNRLLLNQEVTDKLHFEEVIDLAYYSKVTSSKRAAVDLQGWLGYWLWSSFKLNMGGEFQSNNYVNYDIRAIAKLTYLLWKEI